jgi:iron(III) transport system ATP-binding protein
MSDLILQLQQVGLQYPKQALPVVDQVNLTLSQGNILALLGPSGCGKTSLLRLIAGFERPNQGHIEMTGLLLASPRYWLPPEQRQIGVVFQDYALFSHMTVAENIGFGLKPHYSPQEMQQRIRQLLSMVGLEGLAERYPHELSGGQQQRVALVRALAPRPKLLLLDEPLSNLDARVRLRLREEIREILNATGTSAIFVTHDQQEAFAIADQIAVMFQGRLAQVGPPEELYSQPCSRTVAEFLNQANFLPVRRHNNTWETEVGRFEEPTIKVLSPIENLHRGLLMIREEDWILAPHPQGNAVIKSRRFLGQGYRYCLQSLYGRQLYASTPIEVALPIGTCVNLQLQARTYQCFPETEG